MPFEKEDYHLIPKFIEAHEPTKDKPSDVLQKAFIKQLTEDEIRYLISDEQKVQVGDLTFPTQLHALVSSGMAETGVGIVLDRFYKMQSTEAEAKEQKESQSRILDPIVLLLNSSRNTLLHIMAAKSQDNFKKFLTLASDHVLIEAAQGKNVLDNSGFFMVAVNQRGPRNFLDFLKLLPPELVEAEAEAKNENGHTVLFAVARHQESNAFQAFLKILSPQIINDAAKKRCDDSQFNLSHIVAAYQKDAAAFQAFDQSLLDDTRNEMAVSCTKQGFTVFQFAARYQGSLTFQNYFQRLSLDAINEAGRLVNESGMTGIVPVVLFQNYAVLRMLIDIVCPFNLTMGRFNALDSIAANSQLSAKEKESIKKELDPIFYFIKNPAKAMSETPLEFINFVSKYLQDPSRKSIRSVDYAKWTELLRAALTAGDPKDPKKKSVYDSILVLMHQASSQAETSVASNCEIYADLCKLSKAPFANASSNAFVGEFLTRYGSPLEKPSEAQEKTPVSPELAITLAALNYNEMYATGLSYLKAASDGYDLDAEILLGRRLFSFEERTLPVATVPTTVLVLAETKSKPKEKSVPLSLDDAKDDEESSDIDKKLNGTIKTLQQRTALFNHIGWDKLSSQFQKAGELKTDDHPAQENDLVGLALLKIRVEKAEMGSDEQRNLFAQFCSKLRVTSELDAYSPKKGFTLFVNPYTAWLKETLAIANDCNAIIESLFRARRMTEKFRL